MACDNPLPHLNRRAVLAGLAAAALPVSEGTAQGGTDTLRRRAEAKGILFGTAIGPMLDADRRYRDAVIADCNLVVPEYEMKWKDLSATPSSYDFTAADRRVAFARDHNMAVRGHTLVWFESMPVWFQTQATRLNVEEYLASHIGTVVGRYAGRIHSWDVVNEPLDTTGDGVDGFRRTGLLELIGPNYIDLSFRLAAAIDPKARLVMNEFGTAQGGREADDKRRAVLHLLEGMLKRGVPVHGCGIQGHVATDGKDAPDIAALGRFCREIEGLGLEIMLTELDVSDQFAPADPVARDRAVADTYRRVLDVVLDNPAARTLLTWGLSDRNTWLAEHRARPDGQPVRPLLYDREMKKKPAWQAVSDALDNASPRPARA